MKINWKDRFKAESNQRLFEIFSEKKRINIDPQIFAGNILFERKYKLQVLQTAKKEMIDSIEEAFERKYFTDPKKIRKENTIRELFIRSMLVVIVSVSTYTTAPTTFELFSLTIDKFTMAVILGVIVLLPLLRIKKSNEKAVEKVKKEREKKDELIRKINRELLF